jgi:transcriptional/translational regulatory protein YebC/TACO1
MQQSVGAASQAMRFEGYGPGGVALMLECVGPDRTSMAVELRRVFSSHGGHLGAAGSVAYLFNEVGVLTFCAQTGEVRLRDRALEAGAEEVIVRADGRVEVLTDPIELDSIRRALSSGGFEAQSAHTTERAFAPVPLDAACAASHLELIADLKRLPGVRSIYTNAEIPDAILASL